MLVIFELLYLSMNQQEYADLVNMLKLEALSVIGFMVHEYESMLGN